jgi:predicted dehydrogenase
VNASRRGRVVGVGSRFANSAENFARSFDVANHYGSYDALLADKSVEAVYNSLPNSLHREWTIKALRAGKHVLCEKPFAMDTAEAEQMFDAAQQTGRRAGSRRSCTARTTDQGGDARHVRAGILGRLRMIRLSFCYRTTKVDGNIRFARELGGGALLDIGCYCTISRG